MHHSRLVKTGRTTYIRPLPIKQRQQRPLTPHRLRYQYISMVFHIQPTVAFFQLPFECRGTALHRGFDLGQAGGFEVGDAEDFGRVAGGRRF